MKIKNRKITKTKTHSFTTKQLASAFSTWRSRYLKNPKRYNPHGIVLPDYGISCAATLLSILKEGR